MTQTMKVVSGSLNLAKWTYTQSYVEIKENR